ATGATEDVRAASATGAADAARSASAADLALAGGECGVAASPAGRAEVRAVAGAVPSPCSASIAAPVDVATLPSTLAPVESACEIRDGACAASAAVATGEIGAPVGTAALASAGDALGARASASEPGVGIVVGAALLSVASPTVAVRCGDIASPLASVTAPGCGAGAGRTAPVWDGAAAVTRSTGRTESTTAGMLGAADSGGILAPDATATGATAGPPARAGAGASPPVATAGDTGAADSRDGAAARAEGTPSCARTGDGVDARPAVASPSERETTASE
ncbi:MAG TPA: hypothetical protein VFQ39_05685, partial [Longimicrobium sp.]|nr:hypothetical protein [Longimicrobium sp.]